MMTLMKKDFLTNHNIEAILQLDTTNEVERLKPQELTQWGILITQVKENYYNPTLFHD